MVVLPYYLHDFKAFGRITILGEFLAIAAVTMCMLFIFVDMGQPMRVLNVLLYPTPRSMMFWDMISPWPATCCSTSSSPLVTLGAERRSVAPPRWITARHHPVDPVGHQHPHRHGVPVQRPARPVVLADRDPGPAIPRVGLRRGAGAAHPALPAAAAADVVRRGPRAHSASWRSSSPTRCWRTCSSCCWSCSPPSTAGIPEHSRTSQYLYVGLEAMRRSRPGCGPQPSSPSASLFVLLLPLSAGAIRVAPGRRVRDGVHLALDRQGPRPDRGRASCRLRSARFRLMRRPAPRCSSPWASGRSGSCW